LWPNLAQIEFFTQSRRDLPVVGPAVPLARRPSASTPDQNCEQNRQRRAVTLRSAEMLLAPMHV
jgi:hypothetical protein